MSAQRNKLYRSRTNRMIGGVCGGLGDFFDIDATLIRLLFVFFALAGGPGLLVYLVMLLIVPEEPLPESQPLEPIPPLEPDVTHQPTDPL